ncbi:hypothetical protein A2U01_0070813, partial [Trifolium medium]|nr:hypothetical protein [Trifolium medium]
TYLERNPVNPRTGAKSSYKKRRRVAICREELRFKLVNGTTANTESRTMYQQPPEQSSRQRSSFERNSPNKVTWNSPNTVTWTKTDKKMKWR